MYFYPELIPATDTQAAYVVLTSADVERVLEIAKARQICFHPAKPTFSLGVWDYMNLEVQSGENNLLYLAADLNKLKTV